MTSISSDPIACYLSSFVGLYPRILEWYASIVPEISTGGRSMIGLVVDGELKGLAVTKNKAKAKLCHISILEDERQRGLGSELLRAAITTVLQHGARSVHVTTSEEVAETYGFFFSRVGFSIVDIQKNRYRRGSSEFIWKASAFGLSDRVIGSCRTNARPVILRPVNESVLTQPIEFWRPAGDSQISISQWMNGEWCSDEPGQTASVWAHLPVAHVNLVSSRESASNGKFSSAINRHIEHSESESHSYPLRMAVGEKLYAPLVAPSTAGERLQNGTRFVGKSEVSVPYSSFPDRRPSERRRSRAQGRP